MALLRPERVHGTSGSASGGDNGTGVTGADAKVGVGVEYPGGGHMPGLPEGGNMLTAYNPKSGVQEIMATECGELAECRTKAEVSILDEENSWLPYTGKCRVLAVYLQAGYNDAALLEIRDTFDDRVLMTVKAMMTFTASFAIARGVECRGTLYAYLLGMGASALVYWVRE